MEQDKTEQKINSSNQREIIYGPDISIEQSNIPTLVNLCSNAIVNFLVEPKNYPKFRFDKNKLHEELNQLIEFKLQQCPKAWKKKSYEWERLIYHFFIPYVHCLKISPDSKFVVISLGKPKYKKVPYYPYKECNGIKEWYLELFPLDNRFEGFTLKGHKNEVNSIAISEDGKIIVTASTDKTTKIWQSSSGKCLQTLEDHTESVCSVAISSDSKYIVTTSRDKTAKIWYASEPKNFHYTCINTLKGHNRAITATDISWDNNFIVTGSADRSIKVWDIKSGECLQTIADHNAVIKTVNISSDNKYIFSHSSKGLLVRLDLESGEITTFTNVNLFVVSHNSKFFAIVSNNNPKIIEIYDANSCKSCQIIKHELNIKSLAISENGRFIIGGLESIGGKEPQRAVIWDIRSGFRLCNLKSSDFHICHNHIKLIDISPDNKFIVVGTSKGSIMWEINYPNLNQFTRANKNRNCLTQ